MVDKYISKLHKPEITEEDVNTEIIKRHLNYDGKQLYIRIPTKIANIFNLKNRQATDLIINYKDKEVLLKFKDNIVDKNKRKSNLKKIKKKK